MTEQEIRDITIRLIEGAVSAGLVTREQADGFVIARDEFVAAPDGDQAAFDKFQATLVALGMAEVEA